MGEYIFGFIAAIVGGAIASCFVAFAIFIWRKLVNENGF